MNKNKDKISPSPQNEAFVHRIAVNLLPPELILSRNQNFRLTLINKLSVLGLVLLIFLTSATIAMRISQNTELKSSEDNLVRAEGLVSGLRETESRMLSLKNRLQTIDSLRDLDSNRKAIFNTVVFLIPSGIEVSEISVDKNGQLAMSLTSSTLASVQELLENLESREKTSNLISKVDLDGFSMGKDSAYRFSLKVMPK